MDTQRGAVEVAVVDLSPKGVLQLFARWRENPTSLSVPEVGALLATVIVRDCAGDPTERAHRDLLWDSAKEVQWAVAAGLKIAPGVPHAVFLCNKRDPFGLRVSQQFPQPGETQGDDTACAVVGLQLAMNVLRGLDLAPVADRLKKGPGPGRVSVLVCTGGGLLLTSVLPVDVDLPDDISEQVAQLRIQEKKGDLH